MAELEQEEMSFWDHLEALRWTLFRSFLAPGAGLSSFSFIYCTSLFFSIFRKLLPYVKSY